MESQKSKSRRVDESTSPGVIGSLVGVMGREEDALIAQVAGARAARSGISWAISCRSVAAWNSPRRPASCHRIRPSGQASSGGWIAR